MTTSSDRYSDILNNGSFCVMPWIHLHVLPDGNTRPCCYSTDYTENIKNYNSVSDLMNAPGYTEIRRKFLNSEKPDGCKLCYDSEMNDREKNSLRLRMNNMFNSEQVKNMVLNTPESGIVDDPTILYFDVRFGNICNLKCRMCGHSLSSTWYDEQKAWAEEAGDEYNFPKFIHIDLYEKIEQYLPYVEEIYFAGGEPLLYPEHLKILDKLIETNNTNTRLRYNTNLTSLNYKGRHIPDVWNKFSNIFISASIDGMDSTVEFIRTNLNWNTFKNNFEYVKSYCSHVKIAPGPTIGILNAEPFVNFVRFITDNDWISDWAILPNFIFQPDNLSLKIAPDWYADYLISLYEDLKQEVESKLHINQSFKNSKDLIEYIITFLKTNKHAYTVTEKRELLDSLKNMLEVYNRTANLDWVNQLPHMYNFFEKHKQEDQQ